MYKYKFMYIYSNVHEKYSIKITIDCVASATLKCQELESKG